MQPAEPLRRRRAQQQEGSAPVTLEPGIRFSPLLPNFKDYMDCMMVQDEISISNCPVYSSISDEELLKFERRFMAPQDRSTPMDAIDSPVPQLPPRGIVPRANPTGIRELSASPPTMAEGSNARDRNKRRRTPLSSQGDDEQRPWTQVSPGSFRRRAAADETQASQMETKTTCDRCQGDFDNLFTIFDCGHSVCFDCLDTSPTKCCMCGMGAK